MKERGWSYWEEPTGLLKAGKWQEDSNKMEHFGEGGG